jgi:hypothetical protein
LGATNAPPLLTVEVLLLLGFRPELRAAAGGQTSREVPVTAAGSAAVPNAPLQPIEPAVLGSQQVAAGPAGPAAEL